MRFLRSGQEHREAAETSRSERLPQAAALFVGTVACASAAEIASGVLEPDLIYGAAAVGAVLALGRVVLPALHRAAARLSDVLSSPIAGPDSGERTNSA